MGAEIKDPCSSAPRTLEDTNFVPQPERRYFCIFRIELILGKKARNLSSILGEDLFFKDYLILETKFNKNGLKVPQFLKNFKNVAQLGKG